MSSLEHSLKIGVIGVIGAGIAGLSAAISLREAGHQVTIYERYAGTAFGEGMYSSIGSSLSFGANLARIIDGWGVGFSKSGTLALREEYVFQDDGTDELKLVKKHDITYAKKAIGYDWFICSHYGLHQGLLEISMNTPRGKQPVTLRSGIRVTELNCNTAKVTTADGQTFPFDMVVIADGVGSQLIDCVTGDTTPAMTP